MPKWTTRRWKRPATMRKERLAELFSKSELSEILNSEFVKGVESRKDLLEGRQYRLWAWQIPLLLFLTLSLLPTKVSGSIFGISIESAKTLREVLIVLSSTLGILSLFVTNQVGYLAEILQVAAQKQSKQIKDLKEFLDVRYGTTVMLSRNFSDEFLIGNTQIILAAILLVAFLLLVGMLLLGGLLIHVLNLIEVWQRPNFPDPLPFFVIAYVVLADIFGLVMFFIIRGVQPYQTFEDLRKLEKLERTDPARYKAAIELMVRKHSSRGILARIFGRPKLPKL